MYGEYEFVSEQIEELGSEYVESLVAKGFKPVYTDHGWKWIQCTISLDRPSVRLVA